MSGIDPNVLLDPFIDPPVPPPATVPDDLTDLVNALDDPTKRDAILEEWKSPDDRVVPPVPGPIEVPLPQTGPIGRGGPWSRIDWGFPQEGLVQVLAGSWRVLKQTKSHGRRTPRDVGYGSPYGTGGTGDGSGLDLDNPGNAPEGSDLPIEGGTFLANLGEEGENFTESDRPVLEDTERTEERDRAPAYERGGEVTIEVEDGVYKVVVPSADEVGQLWRAIDGGKVIDLVVATYSQYSDEGITENDAVVWLELVLRVCKRGSVFKTRVTREFVATRVSAAINHAMEGRTNVRIGAHGLAHKAGQTIRFAWQNIVE